MTSTEKLKHLMEEEKKLAAKNGFLLSALQERLKVMYTEDTVSFDTSSKEAILVKKLLEYREVRNYAVIEKDEEETNLLKIKNHHSEYEQTVMKLTEEVRNRLYTVTEKFSCGSIKNYKVLQELMKIYSSVLFQMCDLIAKKTKSNIKLMKLKEKNNKNNITRGFKEFDYQNLLSKKKEIEDRFSNMKKIINKRKDMLDETVNSLGKTKHQAAISLKRNNELTDILKNKLELIQQVDTKVNILKVKVAKLQSDVTSLERELSLHKYKENMPNQ